MDRDGLISREDLYEIMDMITDTHMTDDCKKRLVDEVMTQAPIISPVLLVRFAMQAAKYLMDYYPCNNGS